MRLSTGRVIWYPTFVTCLNAEARRHGQIDVEAMMVALSLNKDQF